MKKHVYVKNIITIYQINKNENTINIGNNTIGTTLHTHSKEQLLSPTETKRYTAKRCCIVEENKFQSRYSNATEVVSGSGLHLSVINKASSQVRHWDNNQQLFLHWLASPRQDLLHCLLSFLSVYFKSQLSLQAMMFIAQFVEHEHSLLHSSYSFWHSIRQFTITFLFMFLKFFIRHSIEQVFMSV